MPKTKTKGTKGRRTTRKAKLAPTTAKAVKAIVDRAISSKSETKFVSNYAADTAPNTFTSFNSAIAGASQFGNPLAQLTQGDTDYQRTGSQIVPRQVKCALDVRISAGTDPSNSRVYPVDVTVVGYYGYCKKYSTYSDVNANSASLASDLLRLGGVNGAGAETQSFNGIVADSHLVINTDIWHLKKFTFRLYKAGGYLNGTPGNGTQNAPNKNLHSIMLDYSSMCPSKGLVYDKSTDTLPVNWAPVYTMGYYYNDSTPADVSANTGILEYKSNKFLTFKDM